MNKKFHVIKGEHFSETFWNPLYQKVMDGKGTNDEIKLVSKILKTIDFLSINPFYNGLNSHDIDVLSNRYKTTPITVFESYIENNNSRAGRLFWVYSPEERGVIIVVKYTKHPENTRFGYERLSFPDLKKYENKKERIMKRKVIEETVKEAYMTHSFWNNLTSNTTLYGKCDEETKEYLEYVFNDVLEKLVENDDVKDIVKKFKECLVYDFEISPEAQWNLFQNWMWFNDKDNLCKNRNYCFEDVINDVSSHYGRIFNFAIHTSEIYFK